LENGSARPHERRPKRRNLDDLPDGTTRRFSPPDLTQSKRNATSIIFLELPTMITLSAERDSSPPHFTAGFLHLLASTFLVVSGVFLRRGEGNGVCIEQRVRTIDLLSCFCYLLSNDVWWHFVLTLCRDEFWLLPTVSISPLLSYQVLQLCCGRFLVCVCVFFCFFLSAMGFTIDRLGLEGRLGWVSI
jgi:hypothetical protein